ncbi:TRNA arginine adenosine deaminase, putative isoform 2 [Hibiscus syriacus]|uniref:tRNA arginine adenosine deaminase, putative isoform 2 n=1 Tax=Hibiscus syriacus TaxID=106335 RepID=A0A6A2Y4I4_HIBSY|nr:TRNA arginine adenosine deaminase, putative isoform 2 [Hibiscus syriacus]
MFYLGGNVGGSIPGGSSTVCSGPYLPAPRLCAQGLTGLDGGCMVMGNLHILDLTDGRIERGKGMQAITNVSVVHADNTKIVTNTQKSSGERLVEHESNFSSGLGRTNERSEIHNEANGRVEQKKSRKENLKPASVSSSSGKAEGSSFQASLILVSETREQQSHADLEESEKRGKEDGNIISDFTSAYEGDKHGPSSSGQYGKEELKMRRHDSRQSSKGTGGKRPSDEMRDVTDPSVQEPLEAEIPQRISTLDHAVIKRSCRSLWTLMGDIVRLRWRSRAQTRSSSSAERSGGRTSPDESVRSETWFSGHETNENSEENLRRERSNLDSEGISHQLGQGTQGEGDFSDSTRTTEKVGHLGGNISPSSNILETAPASEVISLTSQKEKHDRSSFEVASSDKEVIQSFLPLPAGSTRTSLVVEDISEPDKINIQGSGSIKTMELPLGARVAEASGSEGKEGGLKQRKLQRTKQFPRDRFDEWEEAYKLEREQQKIDEIFMREALLEAKKAADSWEVPVGAVLVQHGKIIARGCNLVEELRDSIVHAEMICIREASSILRSWRLAILFLFADTTLYVTLEPCPMCAGAILQARIDTVLWGAPNKLLGADGSWIRLFPDGRGSGSEVTDKQAAPVHPFHPNMGIRREISASECADMMQQIFHLRRKNKAKNAEQPQPPSCFPITSHQSKFFTKMHDILHLMFCL